MFLFHRLGEFSLALALCSVLAEEIAAEYFYLRDEVVRMCGVREHCVHEVLFVTGTGQ